MAHRISTAVCMPLVVATGSSSPTRNGVPALGANSLNHWIPGKYEHNILKNASQTLDRSSGKWYWRISTKNKPCSYWSLLSEGLQATVKGGRSNGLHKPGWRSVRGRKRQPEFWGFTKNRNRGDERLEGEEVAPREVWRCAEISPRASTSVPINAWMWGNCRRLGKDPLKEHLEQSLESTQGRNSLCSHSQNKLNK